MSWKHPEDSVINLAWVPSWKCILSLAFQLSTLLCFSSYICAYFDMSEVILLSKCLFYCKMQITEFCCMLSVVLVSEDSDLFVHCSLERASILLKSLMRMKKYHMHVCIRFHLCIHTHFDKESSLCAWKEVIDYILFLSLRHHTVTAHCSMRIISSPGILTALFIRNCRVKALRKLLLLLPWHSLSVRQKFRQWQSGKLNSFS